MFKTTPSAYVSKTNSIIVYDLCGFICLIFLFVLLLSTLPVFLNDWCIVRKLTFLPKWRAKCPKTVFWKTNLSFIHLKCHASYKWRFTRKLSLSLLPFSKTFGQYSNISFILWTTANSLIRKTRQLCHPKYLEELMPSPLICVCMYMLGIRNKLFRSYRMDYCKGVAAVWSSSSH